MEMANRIAAPKSVRAGAPHRDPRFAAPAAPLRAWRAVALIAAVLFALAAGTPFARATSIGNGPDAVEWEAPVEIATGDAFIGPWRMNRSRFHYVDDPAVGIINEGPTGVAWVDNREKDVFFQAFGPDGRARDGVPVNVSRSPDVFSWLPKLVMAEGGRVFVLWQEILFTGGSHGGEVLFAHSRDGGRTFSPPQNLSNSEAGDGKGRLTREHWDNGSLALARADDGTLYAAWTEYEGALWLSRAAEDASFGPPQHIAGSMGRPARAPDLAVAPDGTVYLAWTVGEDAAANIHLTRSTDGGRSFTEPRPLFAGDAHADAPKLAVDQTGAVHLVFAVGRHGAFGPHHVHYARLDATGAPVIGAMRISGAGPWQGAHFPYLALDRRDNVVAVWEHYPHPTGRPYGLGMAVSLDRGRKFSAAALVPGTAELDPGFNGSLQGMLMQKLAVSGEGSIRIVNSRIKPGDHSRIRLLLGRLTPDG